MQHQFLSYKNSRISYYRFGAGPRMALCFHGYGEDVAGYFFLEKYAGEQYNFIALDLPFHGQTEWNEGLDFTNGDLQQIISKIFNKSNVELQTSNFKYSLIGFSLGGRVALSLYQLQPETIERIILLAPDGLKINSWYWFSTQTWLGNKIFVATMKYPGWFFSLLKIMNRLRLINASVFKFTNYYIGNESARQLLYQRWTSLRRIKPNLKRIKSLIRKYNTITRLIYGKHDRIILPVRGEKFKKGIEEYCTVTIIESGHQVLHEKHAEEIISALFH